MITNQRLDDLEANLSMLVGRLLIGQLIDEIRRLQRRVSVLETVCLEVQDDLTPASEGV